MYLQALHDLELLCVKFNLLQLNCDDMNKLVSVTMWKIELHYDSIPSFLLVLHSFGCVSCRMTLLYS